MGLNIKLDQFAVAHIAAISYGFEENGDPKPGFHNFVLRTMIKGDEITFFTTRNVGEQSLVDLVNHEGDAIFIPSVTNQGKVVDKRATAVWMVTRYDQNATKLNTLFSGFLNALNNAKWNSSVLNPKSDGAHPGTLHPPPQRHHAARRTVLPTPHR